MVLYLQDLLDDAKCFETVRELRWPNGKVVCPHCGSEEIKRNGFHSTQPHRQRYVCQGECCSQFDDLSETVLSAPSTFGGVDTMPVSDGLELSNRQIAAELGLNTNDVLAKLGLSDHVRAALFAKEHGF